MCSVMRECFIVVDLPEREGINFNSTHKPVHISRDISLRLPHLSFRDPLELTVLKVCFQ